MRVGLGVNATFFKGKPLDAFDVYSGLQYEESTITVKTKLVAVYSKDTSNSITDKLVEDVIKLFDNIVHEGTGWAIKKLVS